MVFAEHSEHGSSAAPIAKYMIETYFAKKEGKPMPAYPEAGKNPQPEPPAEDAVIASVPAPGEPIAIAPPVAPAARPVGQPRRQLRRRMFDERRLQHHIDWPLLTAVLALAGIGLVMIYSATWNPLAGDGGQVGPRFWTHLYAFGIGVGALFVCLFLDYRRLCENSLFIYLGVAAAADLRARSPASTQGGAQRWISLGGFNLQPSEFMKIALALALATYFAENNRGAQNYKDLAIAGGIAGVAFLLIYKQPDLGIGGDAPADPVRDRLRRRSAAEAAGDPRRSSPSSARRSAGRSRSRTYQKERIETFLDPEKDSRGAGYQQIQARISVGSGGLTGKGFRHGTQGQFRFLPGAAQRFHLFGARRGAGVPRRARHARSLSVRGAAHRSRWRGWPRIGTGPTWSSG